MKKTMKLGAYGAAAALMVFCAGCGTEKITIDYVMPAKAIADVSKVNVVSIKSTANVTGNLKGDNAMNAGLMKQLLAMRLYKEGYYQVVDDISGNPDGASALYEALAKKDAGHGYASFGAMAQEDVKAILDIDLKLSLDSRPVKKQIPFTLTTLNFKDVDPKKTKGVPASEPDPKATVVEKVQKEVTVYEIVAKGTLTAKFVGPKGKDVPAYSHTFTVTMPEDARFDSAEPSQLKALAAAITPAINGIVADISPYKESRQVEAIKGGDERVVLLLNAKAFPEVETVVNELGVTGKANFADYENLGIAYEASGNFHSAKDAYKTACKANPESQTAQAGLKRVEEALAGKKAVKKSGAKENKDTKFKKEESK